MFKLKADKCQCGGTFKFSKITRSICCSKCKKDFKSDVGNKQNAKEKK